MADGNLGRGQGDWTTVNRCWIGKPEVGTDIEFGTGMAGIRRELQAGSPLENKTGREPRKTYVGADQEVLNVDVAHHIRAGIEKVHDGVSLACFSRFVGTMSV